MRKNIFVKKKFLVLISIILILIVFVLGRSFIGKINTRTNDALKDKTTSVKNELTVETRCTRNARLENEPKFDRALSLVYEKVRQGEEHRSVWTSYNYFPAQLVNCIKVDTKNVKAEIEAEGYFDINNNDINNKRCNNNNHNTINELSIDINHINNSNNSHTNENSNLNSTNNSNNNHNNHNNHNTNHKSIKKISDLNIKKDLFYIIQEENEKIEEEEERKRRDKCKIINVELIHNNILKSIPVKENTLVKAFKIQVLKAYNLDNIHPSNVRLKSSFKNNQNECTYFLSDNMVINIHNSLL